MKRWDERMQLASGAGHGGGIRMDAFDWNTLESKKHAGVYIAGEVADVDGDCGGYNLQWAFASALTAAEAMEKALG